MTPVEQSVKNHNIETGPIGDCYRACIASLLGLPLQDVPHFAEQGWYAAGKAWGSDSGKVADEMCQAYLMSHGFRMVHTAFSDCTWDEIQRTLQIMTEGCYAMLTGQSIRGVNHSVIVRDGEIVHDPYDPSNKKLVGPAQADGTSEPQWVISYIVVSHPELTRRVLKA